MSSRKESDSFFLQDGLQKTPHQLEDCVKTIPSLKLTWPLKIGHPQRKLALQPSIFRGYVSFRECKLSEKHQKTPCWFAILKLAPGSICRQSEKPPSKHKIVCKNHNATSKMGEIESHQKKLWKKKHHPEPPGSLVTCGHGMNDAVAKLKACDVSFSSFFPMSPGGDFVYMAHPRNHSLWSLGLPGLHHLIWTCDFFWYVRHFDHYSKVSGHNKPVYPLKLAASNQKSCFWNAYFGKENRTLKWYDIPSPIVSTPALRILVPRSLQVTWLGIQRWRATFKGIWLFPKIGVGPQNGWWK